MKRIELKCSCGASIVIEDSSGTYINLGGHPDLKGRIFLMEVQADEWLDRHAACIHASNEPHKV